MLSICQFFLLFTREFIILPVFLAGYFFSKQHVFFRALVLTLWGITIAAFLKFVFKIPLLPHLGEGWSFPSGHMFVACTFWGFLALELPHKLFKIAVFFMLCGVGYALVYCHYHVPIDVLAVALFSFLFITFYRKIFLFSFIGKSDFLVCFIAFLFTGMLLYFISPYKHIFDLSLGGLLGISLGQFFQIFLPSPFSGSRFKKILLCLSGLLLIYTVYPFLHNPFLRASFLFYLLEGFWIITGPKMINIFFSKR